LSNELSGQRQIFNAARKETLVSSVTSICQGTADCIGLNILAALRSGADPPATNKVIDISGHALAKSSIFHFAPAHEDELVIFAFGKCISLALTFDPTTGRWIQQSRYTLNTWFALNTWYPLVTNITIWALWSFHSFASHE
jgi:hypothetical protein